MVPPLFSSSSRILPGRRRPLTLPLPLPLPRSWQCFCSRPNHNGAGPPAPNVTPPACLAIARRKPARQKGFDLKRSQINRSSSLPPEKRSHGSNTLPLFRRKPPMQRSASTGSRTVRPARHAFHARGFLSGDFAEESPVTSAEGDLAPVKRRSRLDSSVKTTWE